MVLCGEWSPVWQIAPEHVLDAIGYIEHADARSPRGFLEGVEKHAFALLLYQVALLEERLVIQEAVVQRPGVLCQAEGGIQPCELGQVNQIGRASCRERV